MTTAVHRLPTNPFATRFTRPGRLPPLDLRGEPLDPTRLLDQLEAGRVAAIVGPHGHGKSTLLAALAEAAGCAGFAITVVRVRSPLDSWRPIAAALTSPSGGFVACDSWERALPGVSLAVGLVAAARRLRVVVTAHARGNLPLLIHCGTSRDLLCHLIERLPDHDGLIDGADIDDAYRRHGGDLREALYDLYDRFERRVRDRHRADRPLPAAGPHAAEPAV